MLNGINIKDIDRNSLAKRMAVLPQNAELMNLTLAENIAFEKFQDPELVERAAEKAGAKVFIDKLDRKFLSVLILSMNMFLHGI